MRPVKHCTSSFEYCCLKHFFQWIFRFAHLRLGMHTVILAHVAFCLAYVVVVVMSGSRSGGRIEQIGKPQDIRARPATPFVRDFVMA